MVFLRTLIFVFVIFSSAAQAETIAATSSGNYSWSFGGFSGALQSVADAWCAANLEAYLPSGSNGRGAVSNAAAGQFYCQATMWDGSTGNYAVYRTATQGDLLYTCPAGQNWTLSGQTCTRPDCVAPATRMPDGTCGDPCAARAQDAPVTGWYPSAVGQPSLESSQYCDSGCTVGLNASPTGTSYANKTTRWQQYSKVQLGYSCTGGLASVPSSGTAGLQPVEPPKNPPCAASEGVLTSSSGTVACVPSGVPGASTPVVTKTKETTPYPDGSAKVTETTTTRDPATGVEQKSVSTTISPATGGGAGQAGTPGTTAGPTTTTGTTSGGDPTKPGDSDFCNKNPGLQICKGGMNEEATQKKVQESLETAFNTDGVTNDEITNKTVSDAKKQEAEDAFDAVKDKLSNGTDASGKQGEFSNAMSTWFEPIPPGTCSPLSSTVGGRTFTFDPCPTAAKISDLAGYALWVYLLFGSFALVTRKAE